MMGLKSFFTAIFSIPKTLYVNFRYLPFSQAIRLPVWCHWNSWVKGNGKIIIDNPLTASIRLGSTPSSIPSQRFVLYLTGVLRFRGCASIGTGTKMQIAGDLTIGDHFACSGGGIFNCWSNCSFGDDVLIGHCCTFMDGDGHRILSNGCIINKDDGIHVGNHVWFGRECLILKGSTICDNVVFGARSVVNGSYKTNNAVYVGTPAKLKKDNISWKH